MFAKKNFNKYREQLLDTAINAFEKVIHKAAKPTGKFSENKIAEAITKSSDNKIVKPKPVIDENSRIVERNNHSTRKDKRNIEWIKTSITKWNTLIKLLNDWIVSKFVTKKCIEVNDVLSGQYSINKNIRFIIPC